MTIGVSTTPERARILRQIIDGANGSAISGNTQRRENTTGSCLPVRPSVLLRALNYATEEYEVTIYQPGDDGDWESAFQTQLARLVSFGQLILHNVGGMGPCVSSSAFWGVNIGETIGAELVVTTEGDELKIVHSAGSVQGTAAIIKPHSTGGLRVTTERITFVRWDGPAPIEDGTIIILDYVGGALTIVASFCEPTPALQGLPTESPAPGTGPFGELPPPPPPGGP